MLGPRMRSASSLPTRFLFGNHIPPPPWEGTVHVGCESHGFCPLSPATHFHAGAGVELFLWCGGSNPVASREMFEPSHDKMSS